MFYIFLSFVLNWEKGINFPGKPTVFLGPFPLRGT